MKLLHNIYSRFKKLRFRTKLIWSYVIILFIPMTIITIKYYYTSQGVISDLTSKNVFEIVRKSNEIMDSKLSKIEENSLSMTIDSDLFKTFNDAAKGNSKNILQMDRQISKVITKYFSQSTEVFSTQIVTSYYTFGINTSIISGDSYTQSGLYAKALSANGGLVWIPTYDFTEMFGHEEMTALPNLNDRYVLSAVRLLNVSYIDNWILTILNENVEKPVLIVNLSEAFFRNTMQDSIPIKGAAFCIIDAEGHVVSHSDTGMLGKTDHPIWLADAVSKKSGTDIVYMDDQRMIVCYDTSRVTGWISAAIIPADELMSEMMPVIKFSIYTIAIIFIFISMLLSIFISSKISSPVKKLLSAFKQMEEGKFNIRVPSGEDGEFGYLIYQFNNMNDKIVRLIEENYLSAIREKETEIMALNLQLNPHFIYNTLNVINWMALEAKHEKISNVTMDLCIMLEYTLKNKRDVVSFEDDLKWLKCYLNIMALRYEDKFSVRYDIPAELTRCRVPKLFLQPFLENAIYHGFEFIEQDGVISISGRIENHMVFFTVEDNGIGMVGERIIEVMSREQSSIGVKNVDKRIKLIFGSEYGVSIESDIGKGTRIIISLPYQTIDNDSD